MAKNRMTLGRVLPKATLRGNLLYFTSTDRLTTSNCIADMSVPAGVHVFESVHVYSV
jgi:hypothetical protein